MKEKIQKAGNKKQKMSKRLTKTKEKTNRSSIRSKAPLTHQEISKQKEKAKRITMAVNQVITLAATIFLISSTSCLNLITKLPNRLYVGISDKPTLSLSGLVNGSHIKTQVYPLPNIYKPQQDFPMNTMIGIPSNCFKFNTRAIDPSVNIALCDGPELHIYKTDSSGKTVDLYLKKAISGFLCDRYMDIGRRVVLPCLSKGPKGYDLNILVLSGKVPSYASTGKKYPLEVSSYKKVSGFITGELSNNTLTHIDCISLSKIFLCMVYRGTSDQNSTETNFTTNLYKFSYNTQNNSFYESDAFLTQLKVKTQKIQVAALSQFYIQETEAPEIYSCSFKTLPLVCNKSKTIPVGNTKMSFWSFDYYYNPLEKNFKDRKSLQFGIFNSLDSNSYRSSSYTTNSGAVVNIIQDCNIDLQFNKELKSSHILHNILTRSTCPRVQAVYSRDYYFTDGFGGGTTRRLIAGYIDIDKTQKTVSYTDLSQLQAQKMVFMLINTYSIMINNVWVTKKVKQDTLTFSPPKNQVSRSIFIRSEKSPSAVLAKYETQTPISIQSEIVSLINGGTYMYLPNITDLVVYNRGWFDFGYSSKNIFGDRAMINMSFVDRKVPQRSQFWQTFNLQAVNGTSDVNINKLVITRGFPSGEDTVEMYDGHKVPLYKVLHTLIIFMDQSFRLNILDCYFYRWEISKAKLHLDKFIKPTYCQMAYQQYFPATTLYNAKRIEQNLFIRTSNQYIDSNGVPRTQMKLLQFSSTFEMTSEIQISPYDSKCDEIYYSELLYTICAFSRVDGQIEPPAGEYPKNGYVIAEHRIGEGTITKTQELIVSFYEYGINSFIKGDTIFALEDQLMAYLVNNDPDYHRLIILKINFLAFQLRPSMHEIKEIDLDDSSTGIYDIKLCHTFAATFVISLDPAKAVGYNRGAPNESLLVVPRYTLPGQNRTIIDMQCMSEVDMFQIRYEDTFSGKQYLVTYFGFDGFRGNKKIHSNIEVVNTQDSMASIGFPGDGRASVFTFTFDSSSIFYNNSYLINLYGPQILFDTSYLVPGAYEVDSVIFNDFTSQSNTNKKAKVSLKVVPSYRLDIAAKQDFLNNDGDTEFPVNRSLSYFADWRGDLYELSHGTVNQHKYIKIQNKVDTGRQTENNAYLVQDGFVYQDAVENYILMMRPSLGMGYIYEKFHIMIQEFNVSRFGDQCAEFTINVDDEYVYVSFTCLQYEYVKFFVLRISRVEKEISILLEHNFKFEFTELKIYLLNEHIFLVMRQKMGDQIQVSKFPILDSQKNETIDRTLIRWRRPGDSSLFTYCKYHLFYFNGVYGVVVLGPGDNYFQIITLDFEYNSARDIMWAQLNSTSQSFSYVNCVGDQDRMRAQRGLRCIAGTQGIQFYEFFLPIFEKNSIKKGGQVIPDLENTYRLPSLRRYQIKEVQIYQDHFLLVGNLGTYITGETEEEQIIDGKATKIKIPLEWTLRGIVYQRGVSTFTGKVPFQTLNKPKLVWDPDQNRTVLLTIMTNATTRKLISKGVQKIHIHNLHSDFEISVIDQEMFKENHYFISLVARGLQNYPDTQQIVFNLRIKMPWWKFLFLAVLQTMVPLCVCVWLWTFFRWLRIRKGIRVKAPLRVIDRTLMRDNEDEGDGLFFSRVAPGADKEEKNKLDRRRSKRTLRKDMRRRGEIF